MHFIIRRPTDYLYPQERLVEILYGLVIALTITSAILVVTGGGAPDINLMVTTSLGAGIAWGIIDAILYILVAIFQKHRYTRIASKISSAKDESEALATIKEDLEDSLVGTLDARTKNAFTILCFMPNAVQARRVIPISPNPSPSPGRMSSVHSRYSSRCCWPH